MKKQVQLYITITSAILLKNLMIEHPDDYDLFTLLIIISCGRGFLDFPNINLNRCILHKFSLFLL